MLTNRPIAYVVAGIFILVVLWQGTHIQTMHGSGRKNEVGRPVESVPLFTPTRGVDGTTWYINVPRGWPPRSQILLDYARPWRWVKLDDYNMYQNYDI